MRYDYLISMLEKINEVLYRSYESSGFIVALVTSHNIQATDFYITIDICDVLSNQKITQLLTVKDVVSWYNSHCDPNIDNMMYVSDYIDTTDCYLADLMS